MDNLNQIQLHTFYHDNAKAKFSQKRKPRGNPKIYYSLRYDIFESLLMNDCIERFQGYGLYLNCLLFFMITRKIANMAIGSGLDKRGVREEPSLP